MLQSCNGVLSQTLWTDQGLFKSPRRPGSQQGAREIFSVPPGKIPIRGSD